MDRKENKQTKNTPNVYTGRDSTDQKSPPRLGEKVLGYLYMGYTTAPIRRQSATNLAQDGIMAILP